MLTFKHIFAVCLLIGVNSVAMASYKHKAEEINNINCKNGDATCEQYKAAALCAAMELVCNTDDNMIKNNEERCIHAAKALADKKDKKGGGDYAKKCKTYIDDNDLLDKDKVVKCEAWSDSVAACVTNTKS
jgi:hypothetical protein